MTRLQRTRTYCGEMPDRLNLGCGLNSIDGWENLDRSPGLILDRAYPLKRLLHRAGLLTSEHMTRWPRNIRIHDVVKGLPYADASVSAIYSSHMLEHLYF